MAGHHHLGGPPRRSQVAGRLLATRAVSLVGDFLTPVALAFAVLDTLGGNAKDVALVVAPVVLGVAAASLWGGVVADRVSPTRVMALADMVRGLCQMTACFLLLGGVAQVWSLAALALVRGLAGGVFSPASRAVWPLVVERDRLRRINGILGLLGGAAVVVGPLIAAVLLAVTSPGLVLGLDGVTFLASAAVLARLPVLRPPRGAASALRDELRHAWSEVSARPWLLPMLVQAALVGLLAAGPLQALGPAVAVQGYGGATAYAMFLSCAGVGALVGGMVVVLRKQDRPLLTAASSLLVVAMPATALALHAPVGLVGAAYLLLGMAEAGYGALWDTELQSRLPQDVLGKVAGLDSLVSFVALPTGTLLAGLLASWVGVNAVLWLAAAAVPAVTLPVLARLLSASARQTAGADALERTPT
jgi:MFS family permease